MSCYTTPWGLGGPAEGEELGLFQDRLRGLLLFVRGMAGEIELIPLSYPPFLQTFIPLASFTYSSLTLIRFGVGVEVPHPPNMAITL
jgi:hypothetical protein